MIFYIWLFIFLAHFLGNILYTTETIFTYFIPITRINSSLLLFWLYLEEFKPFDIPCILPEFVSKISFLVFAVYYLLVHHNLVFQYKLGILGTHWNHFGVFLHVLFKLFNSDFIFCCSNDFIELLNIFVIIIIPIYYLISVYIKQVYPFLNWKDMPFLSLLKVIIIYTIFQLFNSLFDMIFKSC